MTTVFHARPCDRFIEKQSNLWRKKLHRDKSFKPEINLNDTSSLKLIILVIQHSRSLFKFHWTWMFPWMSLILNISAQASLHGFQLLVLLPQLIEITFCCLYQQNKSESKVKFRQGSNHCERVLESTKLAYAYRKKSLTL